ncbi:hypothetical protein LC612_30170 [Nostoc sp. CHAB 5834]|nr:hypothetical protein [Nostoc sp. CHAB 5834]
MPLFEGKVKTRDNRVKSVEVQARNKDEALKHIERLGRVITFRKKFSFDLRSGLTPADRQIFFTRLSAMLAS